MDLLDYNIEVFDDQHATEDQCHLLFDFKDKLSKEYDPDDPLVDRAVRLKYLREKHPYHDSKHWIVKKNVGEQPMIIAEASVHWVEKAHPGYEKNKSTGGFSISVLKEYRRQGIGTELFKLGMIELENHEDIEFIIPGSRFQFVWELFEKYGGKFSQEGAENRLYLNQVDWDMIRTWQQNGQELADRDGVTLEMFEDVPEDILDEYVKIYFETMNQQPLGEWDGEITVTPESVRMNEKRNREKGMERYTLISREKDGTISGLTEIFRHSGVSHRGMQNLTGVLQQYRGRGLGKWLKAEMLLRMREKFPEWMYISTGNDETNAPMLSINNRMGFKKFQVVKSYKFSVQKLKEKFEEFHSK